MNRGMSPPDPDRWFSDPDVLFTSPACGPMDPFALGPCRIATTDARARTRWTLHQRLPLNTATAGLLPQRDSTNDQCSRERCRAICESTECPRTPASPNRCAPTRRFVSAGASSGRCRLYHADRQWRPYTADALVDHLHCNGDHAASVFAPTRSAGSSRRHTQQADTPEPHFQRHRHQRRQRGQQAQRPRPPWPA